MRNRAKIEHLQKAINFGIQNHYIDLKPEEHASPIIVLNKLVTTLLYEANRHTWDGKSCLQIREHICLLQPRFKSKSRTYYENYISAQETEHGTFFGSYLSDDSDSDEEKQYHKNSKALNSALLERAEIFQERAQLDKICYKSKTKDHEKGSLKANGAAASSIFKFDDRHEIHHGEDVDQTVVRRDLSRLNLLLGRGTNLHDALNTLNNEAEAQGRSFTPFYVAEYRGITYLTTKWNKPSRKAHRKDKSELKKPQYSASVHQTTGLNLFRNYTETKKHLDEHPELLQNPAELLREILLTFREPKPYRYENYSYSCLAYALQNIYTQDFHGFHELIKTDDQLNQLLLNDTNPFISMGDTPYHALKYAYGLKPYKGHENERLRPRWQASGRAERPYSGVVYISLHPLTDFDNDGPLHLISLNRQAEIKLKSELNIIAERESCFPSYLPEDRVIFKHTAKYPSFKPGYKTINQYKYGLTPDLFDRFRDGLLNNKPHTTENRNVKQLLGEALCSYQEVRLIDKARKAAEDKGGVLIYRDINGLFSLKPPVDSVNRNTKAITHEIKSPIKEKQARRFNFSKGDSSITEFSDDESTQEFIGELDHTFINDQSSILTDGNLGISMPLSLMLNAVINKRYVALKHFLTLPMFQEAVSEPFNTSELIGGTLLHLAAGANDTTAVQLLLGSENCNIMAFASESTDLSDRTTYYEKITPAQHATINHCNDAARAIIKHTRHNIKITCDAVHNKDLLAGDILISAQENNYGDDDFLGFAWHAGEAVQMNRVRNQTLLHLAVKFNNLRTLNDILNHDKTLLNLRNNDGDTALDCAIRENNKAAVKQLLKAGAKPSPGSHTSTDEILHQRSPSRMKKC